MIIDLERPTMGSIVESQTPMELLSESFKKQTPDVFDRFRSAQSQELRR